MEINLQPGKYVVAVSGGVDSMSLLHALVSQKQDLQLELVVAHYDHGIRPDSSVDEQFVAQQAAAYHLPFVSAAGELGAEASEATARTARYQFLRAVQIRTKAQAIITAHHQDDVLETAILNLLRGTGRKGLSSLTDNNELKRPLLGYTKAAIVAYAQEHHLQWHEDSTNSDDRYRRNYVRHNLIPAMSLSDRQRLLSLIYNQQVINQELDGFFGAHLTTDSLDRQWFTSLPHSLAIEVMASWLRLHALADFDRPTLERLTIKAKVCRPGKRLDVFRNQVVVISQHRLALIGQER